MGGDDPNACDGLAWHLARRPDSPAQDTAEAMKLAAQLVERAPKNAAYWNTLGLVHHRSGDAKAARTALEKARQLGVRREAVNGFLLAMTHNQLGAKDQAQQEYDKAVAWMRLHEPLNKALKNLQSEAADLLKVAAAEAAGEGRQTPAAATQGR